MRKANRQIEKQLGMREKALTQSETVANDWRLQLERGKERDRESIAISDRVRCRIHTTGNIYVCVCVCFGFFVSIEYVLCVCLLAIAILPKQWVTRSVLPCVCLSLGMHVCACFVGFCECMLRREYDRYFCAYAHIMRTVVIVFETL